MHKGGGHERPQQRVQPEWPPACQRLQDAVVGSGQWAFSTPRVALIAGVLAPLCVGMLGLLSGVRVLRVRLLLDAVRPLALRTTRFASPVRLGSGSSAGGVVVMGSGSSRGGAVVMGSGSSRGGLVVMGSGSSGSSGQLSGHRIVLLSGLRKVGEHLERLQQDAIAPHPKPHPAT
eukprot:5262757-Alexandrium_andersonii.AAC.1